MLQLLGEKKVLVGSFIVMTIMFSVVMFFINPLIDGSSGFGVIKLQLAFNKEIGVEIIERWGDTGVANFKLWIFADYIYAASYSVFFASLLSLLIIQKGKTQYPIYTWTVYLAFVAGTFDWVENTLELFFINDPERFSDSLFLLHSIISTLKWTAVPIAVIYVMILIAQKMEPAT